MYALYKIQLFPLWSNTESSQKTTIFFDNAKMKVEEFWK